MTKLSGYQIMWIIVLFDLPVTTAIERKKATQFRKELLTAGFHMSQFSVYYKMVSGRETLERMTRHVSSVVPKGGKVDIVSITDRQYGDIRTFSGGLLQKNRKKGDQLALF